VFEGPFLQATEALYEIEARTKCQELDVGSYLRHVFKRLNEEEERVDYYLDYSTRKKLIQWTEKCFITDYVDTIIAKGPSTLNY
jgi:cullin 4